MATTSVTLWCDRCDAFLSWLALDVKSLATGYHVRCGGMLFQVPHVAPPAGDAAGETRRP